MNMISTGAFLNEMDASNKQFSVANKFAAAWEKKNAKAARAGGVSLMALSLAACGGSSSTTTTTTETDTTTTTTTAAAQSKVFTKDIDILTGGDGDDTFTGDNNTVTAADSVTGGAGTDTVKVYGQTTVPTMSGVENLEVHHSTAASFNIATGDLAGISSLTLDGFTVNDTTVTIGAGDAVSIEDVTGAAADFHIAGGTTVTAATLNVTNSGASAATADVEVAVTASKLTSLTVNALGDSHSYIDIEADNGTGTLKTVTINATSDLTIADIDEATTVNAAASTGKVALSTAVDKVTITGGAGNDTVTLAHSGTGNAALQLSASLGAGDDSLVLTDLNSASDLTDSKTTLAGGDGDDTITMEEAMVAALGDLSATALAKKGISGFEKIKFEDTGADGDTYDLTKLGINYLILDDDDADDNVIKAKSGFTLEADKTVDKVGATGDYYDIQLSDKAGAGDSITLNIDNTTGAGAYQVKAAEVEIINIDTSGSDQNNTIHLTVANATTINVTTATGNVILDMSDATDQANDGKLLSTVDASSSTSTGGVTFTADASNLAGITFKGSAGGDDVTLGDLSDVVITGAGDDTYDMAAGTANTVDLSGGGKDQVEINSLTGVVTVTGFASDDDIDIQTAKGDDGLNVYTSQQTAQADKNNETIVFTVSAKDNAFTTGGSEKIADFTDTTDVAAWLEEAIDVDANDEFYVALNDGTNSYVYYVHEQNDTTIDAGEVVLAVTVENYILDASTVAVTN